MSAERIDHAAEARRILGGLETLDSAAQVSGAAAIAQAHATLALVEQQRLANVIALSSPQDLPNGGEASIPSWSFSEARLGLPATLTLRDDIREGLGL